MRRYIIGLFMVVCLVFGMVPDTAFAATTSCTVYSGTNVEGQNYSRWASPISSYLAVCEDGNLMRVQAGSDVEGILVEYYDTSYNLLRTQTVTAELPIFGGFYETSTNYFLLTGQNNSEESAEVEVYRITKYDKNWKRLGSCGLYDCNTTVPFNAGSARMDVCGDYLLIHTSHEMYQTSDGYNHQANVTIEVDTTGMMITDSYTQIMNSGYGYISHSFNQFIKIEENKIVALNHGDAYPRSIALVKYQTDVSEGAFVPDYYTPCIVTDVLTFPGDAGENVTGASVGGFEISDSAYLIAGNSVIQDESNLTRTTRNVFVASVDKSTSEVTMNQITNYDEGDGSTTTPQFVKISDDQYLLLWSRANTVYYTEIDGSGTQTGNIYSVAGNLSDCVPVVANGKLLWYTWKNETNTFYEIDLTDLSQTQTTIIENGHQYENQGITDGYASLKCSQCDDEKEVAVITSMPVYWGSNKYGTYSTASPDSEQLIGNTHYWMIDYSPTDANSEIVVEISDPEVISNTFDDDGDTDEGVLKMLKKGTATVIFYPKYNPTLTKTYTFVVDDHTHDYEWKSTSDGIATFSCSVCGDEQQEVVPTSIGVHWSDTGSSYSSKLTAQREVGSNLYYMCSISPYEANNYMEIIIENPDILSLESKYESQSQGTFTALKTGKTQVTFRAKYNPTLSKTYTIMVNGDLEATITADKASPQLRGTEITLCAEAVGGSWDYQYQFYEICDDKKTIIQNYGDDNTCVWRPDSAGTRELYVDIQDSDGTTVTKSMSYEVESFELTSAALELENDITVIFKAPASLGEKCHNLYVEVVQEKENGDTESQKIEGVKSADGESYEFRYTGVDAKEAGDNLDVTIYAYDEQESLIAGGTLEDYSVKAYCMNQLAKTDEELTTLGLSEAKQQAFRTLLVDLLNYSAQAQGYFDYKTETMANADLSEEQKAYASEDTVVAELQNITNTKQVEISQPSAVWKTAGLNLLSKTTIRLKFAYEGEIDDVVLVAKVGEGEEVEITEFTPVGNNLYYVYFDGVCAYQFGTAVDFTLKQEGEAISNTLRYSIESYASQMKEKETVGEVVAAMMKYGKAAACYKEEQ